MKPAPSTGRKFAKAASRYLTELVRSSNFPFKYVSKEKTNLLIDNDTGDNVMAQLFFDTDGTGTTLDVNQRPKLSS
jgi:hypothetical protein